MSTLKVNTILNAAGTGTPAIDGLAKAWVNFNGTGTVAIRAAFNVGSITDHGTGLFTVNFTIAMPDANYSACFLNGYGSASTNDRYHIVGFDDNVTAPAAGSCRIRTATLASNLADVAYITVAFFR